MAVTTLRPAYNYSTQFSAVPGGQNFSVLADIANDATLVESAVAAIDLYGLTRPGNDIYVVSAVDLVMRARVSSGTGSVRGTYQVGGTTVNTSTQALNTTWTDYTWSGIARPGGGTWTGYDLAAMLAGPEAITGMTGPVQVSGLAFNVTHTVRATIALASGSGVDDPALAEPDPVLYTTTMHLAQADFDSIAVNTVLTVGRFTLPGMTQPVILSLSLNGDPNPINPPSY